MCGVCGVPHQHQLVTVPPGVSQSPEIAPRCPAHVRVLSIHQPMAIEVLLEYPLQECDAVVRGESVEAEARPGFRGTLDDARARLGVEAVRVKPDPPGIG